MNAPLRILAWRYLKGIVESAQTADGLDGLRRGPGDVVLHWPDHLGEGCAFDEEVDLYREVVSKDAEGDPANHEGDAVDVSAFGLPLRDQRSDFGFYRLVDSELTDRFLDRAGKQLAPGLVTLSRTTVRNHDQVRSKRLLRRI